MKRVLVIEDDDAIRDSIVDILSDEGYEVLAAENGSRGLEALEKEPSRLPSMILLDLTMPVMNGMEFLEHQKKNDAWKAIPTVVFTAAGGRSKPELADGFLRKPIQLEDLLATVGTFSS